MKRLTMKNLGTGAAFMGVLMCAWMPASGAHASKLDASDWAIMERLSYGPTARMVERYERIGKARWIDEQLRWRGDACLPGEARDRIASLGYERYDPMATAKQAREQAKQAKQSGESKAAAGLGKAYKAEPIEQAFERKAIRAMECDQQLQERLASFFMNHFNVYGKKGATAIFLPDYEERAIRPRMFGRFEELLLASLEHPAMMIYLDNAQNAKGRINENYARELMELHTMGTDGGYTQGDVAELARILTGAGMASMDAKRQAPGGQSNDSGFEFDPRRHDQGAKQLLGKAYPAGGGYGEIKAAVAQLARHPSTAKHMSWKLAAYFLGDKPSKEVVDAMAKAYMGSDGRIDAVLRAMIESKGFSSPALTKFKDPETWVFSALRLQYGEKAPMQVKPMMRWMSELGQSPYMKLTPDGYSSDKGEWSSSDQMGKRFEFAGQIIGSAGALYARGDRDDKEARKVAAASHPKDPKHLWSMSWRYESDGLAKAIAMAKGDAEKRALVLASPEFMKR